MNTVLPIVSISEFASMAPRLQTIPVMLKLEKEQLPHKIWTECINCPSFPDCGEIALIKTV